MTAAGTPPQAPPPAQPDEHEPHEEHSPPAVDRSWFDRLKFDGNIGLNVFVPTNVIGRRAVK